MAGIAVPDPGRQRLLILDDEPSVLIGMQRYFQAVGFDVDCAEERREAEALLGHVPYDCLIADLCLTKDQDPDGLNVVEFARHASPGLRIVVLTAAERSATEAEALRLGADLFIGKPAPMADVVRAVRMLLGDAEGAA